MKVDLHRRITVFLLILISYGSILWGPQTQTQAQEPIDLNSEGPVNPTCGPYQNATHYTELGAGTEKSPYLICTVAQLKHFLAMDFRSAADTHIELAKSLNLENQILATQGQNGDVFNAKFSGGGYSIQNFILSGNGLFREIGIQGKISNLVLKGVSFAELGTEEPRGAIAATNNGELNHVDVESNIQGEKRVGGLVGQNSGTIMASSFSGSVLGEEFIGGITGQNLPDGIVRDSHTMGHIVGRRSVGGIAGKNQYLIFKTSSWAIVSESPFYPSPTAALGGIVGENLTGGGIFDCYFSQGSVAGSFQVGGIAGIAETGSQIVNSYVDALVKGTTYSGGLIGYGHPAEIQASFWNTSIPFQTSKGVGDSPLNHEYGIPQEQLVNPLTFISAGWDFNHIWQIPSHHYISEIGKSGPILQEGMADLPSCTIGKVFVHHKSVGKGTLDSPFAICRAEQLLSLASSLEAGDHSDMYAIYQLYSHITLDKTPMIGTEETPFRGTFKGDNYTIEINSSGSSQNEMGLFGHIGSTARVENLNLKVSLTGLDANAICGLALSSRGEIENVHVVGRIYSDSNNQTLASGLVCNHEGGEIKRSSFTGDITAYKVGGIAGDSRSRIEGVLVKGNMQNLLNADIDHFAHVGGIVGRSFGHTSQTHYVKNTLFRGTIKGRTNLGGIVGIKYPAPGSPSSATAHELEISNCHVQGEIHSPKASSSLKARRIGGIAGMIYKAKVQNSSFSGEINIDRIGEKAEEVGGLIGHASQVDVYRSKSSAKMTLKVDLANTIGGLIGRLFHNPSSIDQSVSTGSIDIAGGYHVLGGLIGRLSTTASFTFADNDPFVIRDSYVDLYFSSQNSSAPNVGGLIGWFHGSSKLAVKSVYSRLKLSGKATASGGLIGEVLFIPAQVESAYWTQEVEDSGTIGVSRCDYNKVYVGPTPSDHEYCLDQKDIVQLTGPATPNSSNFVGFDFDQIWEETHDYPILQWE